jgi:hypothetical protein
LAELATDVRSGDVIRVLYAGKKARYKVIWIRDSGPSHKIQAAIHRFETDVCPWLDLLAEERRTDTTASILPRAGLCLLVSRSPRLGAEDSRASRDKLSSKVLTNQQPAKHDVGS